MQRNDNNDKELKPLRVFLYGPPASGKTKLAEKICRRYGAHYVSVKTMIDETLQNLRENIKKETNKLSEKENIKQKEKLKEHKDQKDEAPALEGEDDDVEETQAVIEDLQEQMKFLTSIMQKHHNILPDEVVVRLMKVFLAKEICHTRGYVLDGYPKTFYQTFELFGQVEETNKEVVSKKEEGALSDEEQQIRNLIGNAPISIMPDYVISLEASDDFICERVMKLPQEVIQSSNYDEFNVFRRLAEFHEANNQDCTALTFFDENGIHPINLKIYNKNTEEPLELDCLFDNLCDIFGEPIPGFGVTAEEEAIIKRLEIEQLKLLEEAKRLEKELMESKARKEYEDKMERWIETLEKLQMEEEKLLAIQSEPMRFYLMKYIFPTLSKGLTQVVKVKPKDLTDFLAEYLFKENPDGRMFDPSYTHKGERILQMYHEEIKDVVNQSKSPLK